MTANLYQILGVAPGAEDAVIRAAYRALMQMYHPDRNDDPRAQSRAREITAAFAVLGDHEKRAAYDAAAGDATAIASPWLAADHRPPPLRNLGIASVGVALAVSLAFALPKSPQTPERQAFRSLAPYRGSASATPAVTALPSPAAPVADAGRSTPLAPAAAASISPSPEAPERGALPSPGPQIGHAEVAKSSVPSQRPQIATAAPPPARAPAPKADDRRAQVERLATGFLTQSLEHADWQKQQLLLSARNRSAASRNMCRSDDCVTEAYLRQIRDTTTIMEGRIPKP